MNEHISTSNHSYVITYGMSREPFGDSIEDDLFYAEPARKQKLDILLHLTQYGNELMLVTGPTGSGKTTLLQQFKSQALDTWKVARIEAKNGIDERKLVQQLFHQMGLEYHGATHVELLEHLEHHFDSLQHSARQAVMLIDDAEHLPVTALKCVLALAAITSKDNKPLLRIILFGEGNLEEKFADPLLSQYSNIVRRNVDLTTFDGEQTAHYILHRLSAAHFSGDNPFTDSVLQKIHKQSNGWPGEINQLAHNLLVEAALTTTDDTDNKTLPTFNITRAITAAIGIAVISALLFFQDNFNDWINTAPDDKATAGLPQSITQDLEIPTKAQPNDTVSATPGTTPPATETAGAPQNLPTDDPAVILAQMYGDKESNNESDNDIDTALRAVDAIPDDESTPELTAVTETAAKPAATEMPSKTAPVPTVATNIIEPTVDKTPEAVVKTVKPAHPPVAAVKPTTPKTSRDSTQRPSVPADLPGQRSDWILKQKPAHYTLQLVAGNDIKTLRAFSQQHSLSMPLAVYRSTRKGKPWFGLIHGVFPNKQQAIDARSRLSKTLRRVKPWVREFAPLQKELR